jgi:protein tyrosine phosphatase (PTP) superfamily phosphohydrolase (DUF442 family)
MSGRLWALAAVCGLAGCCGTGSRSSFFTGKPPCDRCGQNKVPPPGVRIAPYPTDPAGVAPAPFLPPTQPAQPTQLPPYTPPPVAGDSAGPVGMNDPYVRPALDAQVRLDGPQKSAPEPGTAQARLDVPLPVRTDAKPPAAPVAPPAPEPLVRSETQEPPPVDIPGYATVRAQVANGQQPFPDGIAWLKTKGYRTVLHLRAPGEDGAAARRQFEKRGLQYVSLEVAPGALTKDLADQFGRIVADQTNLPLFVYDRDGALTGSLWYLHFRLNGMADDKALAEANRLGFRPEQDEDHKALLNAARTLLAGAQE